MRIIDLNLRKESGCLRAEAHVIWEDVERPAFPLFVETDARHAHLFRLDPNAFLTMCLVPAWEARERRIKVDDALCPVLCENARAAALILGSWYHKVGAPPKLSKPPEIVAENGYSTRMPSEPKSICLMSCGIDSLATFRWHRLHLPDDHPANIHAVLAVAFEDEPAQAANPRLEPATDLTQDTVVEPIGVRTNLQCLVEDGHVYSDKWHGSALTGLASFFSGGFARTYIASSSSPTDLYPWGSHPLLDPFFSSAHFQVEHHGLQLSRLEKTKLVADWPAGLRNIRVCNNDPTGTANCGTCFKCITTMTSLAALGKLEDCAAFPGDMTPELLHTMEEYEMIDDDHQVEWFCELIPSLRTRGRTDLVAAIETIFFS